MAVGGGVPSTSGVSDGVNEGVKVSVGSGVSVGMGVAVGTWAAAGDGAVAAGASSRITSSSAASAKVRRIGMRHLLTSPTLYAISRRAR